jgi:predicted enzyme related to lactoylglutathione lyase
VTVLRIVANLKTADPQVLAAFYGDLFGLDLLMDNEFITTIGAPALAPMQISLASEGGSGTAVPALSIEVDDLDAVLDRAGHLGCAIPYGPVIEPWGVRRFYLRDPAGTLVNVLTHI